MFFICFLCMIMTKINEYFCIFTTPKVIFFLRPFIVIAASENKY